LVFSGGRVIHTADEFADCGHAFKATVVVEREKQSPPWDLGEKPIQ
jgi:hypothetical protein